MNNLFATIFIVIILLSHFTAPPLFFDGRNVLPESESIQYNGASRDYDITYGQVASWQCDFRGNASSTRYSWYKNGVPMKGTVRDNGEKVSAHFDICIRHLAELGSLAHFAR